MTVTQQDLNETINNFRHLITLLGLSAELKADSNDNAIHLCVKTDDAGRLIGRKGQTLQALQHLLNGILLKSKRTFPKVFIDVIGLQTGESRRNNPSSAGNIEKIRKSTVNAAKEVVRWGEQITLTIRNDVERREVERTLGEYPEVVIDSASVTKGRITLKLKEQD